MTACLWAGSANPRVLSGHHEPDCPGDCRGCQPCPERHCVVCGRNHAAVTCTECVAAARDDLEAIGRLCGDLPAEAAVKGVDSEAMMLLGPTADPQAWEWRAAAAFVGRVPDAYLEDCRDELHPLWILGRWEQEWRDHLDHLTEQPLTTASAAAYLGMQLAYMADQPEPPFEEFARELRACRGHLEDVLRDGIRDEKTRVPCQECGRRLVKVYAHRAADDHWLCPSKPCGRSYNAEEFARAKHYHLASEWADKFIRVSEALSAIPRPEQTVRGWMRSGDVRTQRDGVTGAVYVWWPDVRIMHLNTPTRNRRSA